MKEKFLQYLWNYKLFKTFDFTDIDGIPIEILDFGKWNFNSGPDFYVAKIKYKGLILAGNIELHIKSSDYIFHNHEGNKEFDNLILHVVYEHDIDLENLKKRNVPTLELREFTDTKILKKYAHFTDEAPFIPCETIFTSSKLPFHFAEENLLKKLHEKSTEIENSLVLYKNNYEAVLFHWLAYSFGLKINAGLFKQIAEEIDFTIIQKIRQNKVQLEALLFGKAGWLHSAEDEQTKIWKKEYDFIKNKFSISEVQIPPKFLRLRPPNFPTIRLSQLADLYHQHQNLFSKIMDAKNTHDLVTLFEHTSASKYWNNHFVFGKKVESTNDKKLTNSFIHLILINAVLPLKYTYYKNIKPEIADEILEYYAALPAESNTIVHGWKKMKVPMNSAIDTQAFLFQYNHFCCKKKCLECSIGFQLLKE